MNIRLGIVFAIIVMSAAAPARSDIFDVKTYGATPNNNTDDDAPAFRSAIAAAMAAGGGTVYVPAGSYLLKTADGSSDYILATYRGVKIAGDSGGAQDDAGSAGFGSVIHTDSTSLTILDIQAYATNTQNFVQRCDGTIVENLKFVRDVSPASGAYGIRLSSPFTFVGSANPGPTTLSNLLLVNHDIGIGAQPRSATYGAAQWESLRVHSCICRKNNTYGLYVEDFRNLSVIASEFKENGHYDSGSGLYAGAGLTIRPYMPTSTTAFVQGCVCRDNLGIGLNVRGEQTYTSTNLAQNIHVAACLFENNIYQGFNITQSKNVEVATCTVSGNQGGSGNNIGACSGVSVIGCTFAGNLHKALYVNLSTGVTVASCAFNGNSAGTGATDYAIVVLAGSSQSYSNLTFTGSASSGPQQRGISLAGNGNPVYDPTGILMQGLNFEGGMTSPFTLSAVTASAKIRVDFMSPQSWTATYPYPTLSAGLYTYSQ